MYYTDSSEFIPELTKTRIGAYVSSLANPSHSIQKPIIQCVNIFLIFSFTDEKLEWFLTLLSFIS